MLISKAIPTGKFSGTSSSLITVLKNFTLIRLNTETQNFIINKKFNKKKNIF